MKSEYRISKMSTSWEMWRWKNNKKETCADQIFSKLQFAKKIHLHLT